MSIPVPTPPSPAAVFQSHFGVPPGTLDPKMERQMWMEICSEVIEDMVNLQAELPLPTPTYVPRQPDAH